MNIALLMDRVGELWADALASYERNPELIDGARRLVDEFFVRNPSIERNPRTEAFIGGLAIDRLTTAGVPAPETTTTSNAKVA